MRSLDSDPGQVESQGLTPGSKELLSPSIVETLADTVLAAEVGQRTLALETLQNCRQLGVGINLPALHIHPLRHYSRLALCLCLKGAQDRFSRQFVSGFAGGSRCRFCINLVRNLRRFSA
jgi:hypothetical protein